QIQVSFCCLLRLLLKGVQHVDSLDECGDINHAKRSRFLAHTYLPYAGTDAGHRLPIDRIEPTLHTVQLITSLLPSIGGKGPHIIDGATHEGDWLHRGLYQFGYKEAMGKRKSRSRG